MFHILVVEDDFKLRSLFCTVLTNNGYLAVPAENAARALELLDSEYIDLIISDIMMPGMDGYELIRTLRGSGYQLPILIITAKDRFEDKQKGFLAGTDDYMVKPIDVNEMILRVGALLKRARIATERRIHCGDTVLNYDALTVTIDGRETLLPQKEFYLLYKLLSYPNKIFTRQQLMDEIWGMDSTTDERTVDVHINRLRERFRECGDFLIMTVRGLGYKETASFPSPRLLAGASHPDFQHPVPDADHGRNADRFFGGQRALEAPAPRSLDAPHLSHLNLLSRKLKPQHPHLPASVVWNTPSSGKYQPGRQAGGQRRFFRLGGALPFTQGA